MKLYALVMLGGALGSAARFGMSLWIESKAGEAFPWATIAVNILGSLLIGIFVALSQHGDDLMIPLTARAFVVIGLLGGFTTFSSFSLQTIMLMQGDRWAWAGANVLLSVALCLLATAGGFALANLAFPLKG